MSCSGLKHPRRAYDLNGAKLFYVSYYGGLGSDDISRMYQMILRTHWGRNF